MNKKSNLTIIILNHNVKQLLLNCLSSLTAAKTSQDDWEIIVVDNASYDDSVPTTQRIFPDVKIISCHKNVGFAAGNNIALKTITSEFVLLLNPDTIVYPQTIQTVLQYIKSHSDVGAATCRVELPDGTLDYSCHRHFPDPWNSFLHLYSWFFKKFSKYSNSDITDTIHEIDALSGAFAMIRTQAGRHVNWLDEDYFFNGEDIDFCYKLKLSGWKVMYIPGVKITHFKGSSAKATRSTRLAWSRNSTHAMRLFYQKHLAAKYPALLNYLVYAGIYLLQTVRKLKARYN